jgi:molybdenum cofactor cytidylyltransferase
MSAQIQRDGSRVAGVILAAGDSKRFPELKQLLRWEGKSLVWYAVRAALEGGLNPVVVVTGARGDEVRNALAGEPVEFVNNPDWASGQSSSMKAGLEAVRDRAEAVVMLLADMPRVEAGLVRALVDAYVESEAVIVAPRVGERRGNPVLFAQATLPDLFAVEGDRGGRGLIGSLPTKWVDWDDSILQDIDSLEDYDRMAGGGARDS